MEAFRSARIVVKLDCQEGKMPQLQREEVAELFSIAALELEKAAQHFRTAAEHFRKGEVPRGCAHAFAAQGHLHQANETNTHASTIHAAHALIPNQPG